MPSLIYPNENERNAWSQVARAAYRAGLDNIGHRYSVAATLAPGAGMTVRHFDSLQRGYRAWLLDNDWTVAAEAASAQRHAFAV